MQHQSRFDLGGAQPVPGDVQHVVHPAGDPPVAVLVAARAVAGEVIAGVGAEVGVDHALVVAVHGADLARPAGLDHQVAGGGAFQFLAVRVHQAGLYAEHGQGGGAGLQVHRAGQRRDHDGAGLGLPPGVDDRAAFLAHHLVIPLPGFRVDRLAHGAQQFQAGAVGFGHRLVALAHQGTDGGGRGVVDVDLVLVHHLPVTGGVRVGGHALEHQGGGAVGQRPVDDVAVAGDPAHVGGAPVDVAVLIVEHVLVGQGALQQVAGGGVHHALGLAGGAGGVQGEQRVLAVDPFRFAVRVRLGERVVVPDVTLVVPVDIAAGAFHHQAGVDRIAAAQGLVGVGFQCHHLAAAHAFVGGDQGAGAGVLDAVLEGFRREAAEHHRVNRADAGAGQHGVGRFRDHRHVDHHPVAFFHAAVLQGVGEARHLLEQFLVGDVLFLVGLVALPDDRGLLGALGQVAVDAVVAGVELAALEPGRAAFLEVPVADRVPAGLPVEQLVRALGPERIGIVDGLLIPAIIGLPIHQCLAFKRLRNRVDLLLGHVSLLRTAR